MNAGRYRGGFFDQRIRGRSLRWLGLGSRTQTNWRQVSRQENTRDGLDISDGGSWGALKRSAKPGS